MASFSSSFAAAPAAPMAVKIPPDWLHEPRYVKQSELFDARRAEAKQHVQEKARISPYFDQQFARKEVLNRDTFRKNGVQDVLNKAASLDPSQFHARAICSGSPTRSVMLDKRAKDTRLECLAFEPPEIMRLQDIPKPGAPELLNWWTKVDGYVDDPSPMMKSSLRLQLSPHRRVLGPVDPAKERSPLAVDERRRLKEFKGLLAEKITKISHAMPRDYQSQDRVDVSVIIRAPDLYGQERKSGGGGGGGGGGSSDPPALAFAVSPIKPTTLRSPKRPHRHMENLFLASTSQRVLLDQIKACSPPPALSPTSPSSPSRRPGPGGGLGARSASAFALLDSSSDKLHAVEDYRSSIRCGGFS